MNTSDYIKPLKSIHQQFHAKDLSILPTIKVKSFREKHRTSSTFAFKQENFSVRSSIRRENEDLFNDDFYERSSTLQSLSSLENVSRSSRPRPQLTYLLSIDLLESSPQSIYPNVREYIQGLSNEKNIIFIYTNTFKTSNRIPLVFLGSEYFLRQKMSFHRFRYPIVRSELIEPLIDLFLHRPQFSQEIPQLVDLSTYRFLPEIISARLFFDSSSHSSARHLCQEWRSKENKNKFTIDDLYRLSKRENYLIQINALTDRRYQTLKENLYEIYSYETTRKNI